MAISPHTLLEALYVRPNHSYKWCKTWPIFPFLLDSRNARPLGYSDGLDKLDDFDNLEKFETGSPFRSAVLTVITIHHFSTLLLHLRTTNLLPNPRNLVSHSARDPPVFPIDTVVRAATSSFRFLQGVPSGFPPPIGSAASFSQGKLSTRLDETFGLETEGGPHEVASSSQSAFPPSFTPELQILLTALRSSNLETSPTPQHPILQLTCLPVRESRMRNRKRSFRHFLPKGQTKKRSEFLPLTSFFQPRVCCYDKLADVRLSLRLSPASGAQLYHGPKYPLDQAHLLFLSPPLETSFSDCQRSALTAFF